jgi:hypothetical protein
MLTFQFSGGYYLSLWRADPLADPSAEVVGGAYVRQAFGLSAPSGKAVATDRDLLFTGLPVCTVTHLAAYTAVAAGDLEFVYEIVDAHGDPAPLAVAAGGEVVVPAGDLALAL